MPLKCLAGETVLHSFSMTNEQWLALKSDYRSQSLVMPCCRSSAIPKTSKLGTPFFYHANRNRDACTSGKETKEHLLAKFLVAKAAHEAGWEVEVEAHGETPRGGKWFADILASRGVAKVAIEIQWSSQTHEETQRRQARYAESGVRGVWLMRIPRRREIYLPNTQSDYDHPVFPLQIHDSGDDFNIPQFDTTLDAFIHHLLKGDVYWSSRPKSQGFASLRVIKTRCYKCCEWTGVVEGVDLNDKHGLEAFSYDVEEPDAKPFIIDLTKDESFRRQHRIGKFKERYSKSREIRYYANHCIHCNAFIGVKRMFVKGYPLEEKVGWHPFRFTKEQSKKFGEWRISFI